MNITSEYFNSRDFTDEEQAAEFAEMIVRYRDHFLEWARHYTADFSGHIHHSGGLSTYYLEWCQSLKEQSKLSETGEPLRTIVALRADILLAAVDLILREPKSFDLVREVDWTAISSVIPRPMRTVFNDFDPDPYDKDAIRKNERSESSRLEIWYLSLSDYDDVWESK